MRMTMRYIKKIIPLLLKDMLKLLEDTDSETYSDDGYRNNMQLMLIANPCIYAY